MAVIFVNQRGQEVFLSPSILRRDLALLQNRQVEGLSSVSFDVLEGPLGTIFSKLNVNIKKISSVDVETYFKRQLDIEDLEFIFSLSRTHFLAIVYLLYENIMSIDDVKKLLKNDYYTRNEILMSTLNLVESEGKSLVNSFTESISLLNRNRLRKTSPSPKIAALKEDQRIIPDHFYSLKELFSVVPESTIFLNPRFSDFNSFSNVNWVSQAPTIGGTPIEIDDREKKRGFFSWDYTRYIYYKGIGNVLGAAFFLAIAAVVNPIGWLFSIPALIFIAIVGFDAIRGYFEYKDYTSYLDYLKKTSRFRSSVTSVGGAPVFIPAGRRIESDKVLNLMLNRFFSEQVRKVYSTRINYSLNNNEESIFLNNNNNAANAVTFLKDSISYAISDENALATSITKPRYISFFHFLYWMHENKGSNFSTLANFNYNDYEVNPSNIYRQDVENQSLNNTVFNFEYLNYNPSLKNTLLELFPETQTIKRSDESYLKNYFVNSVLSNSTETGIHYLPSTRISISNALNKIMDNDFLILDDLTLSSLNSVARAGYINTSLNIAFDSIGLTELDITNFSSFTQAKNYIDGIKVSVRNSILSQTASNNSEISRRMSNDVFKFLFADIVDSYFNYLVSGNLDPFIPKVSADMLKSYRVLNFIKHTFILAEPYFNLIKDSAPYKDFMMLLLSVKNDLQYSEIVDILRDGISISEIETLLGKSIISGLVNTGGSAPAPGSAGPSIDSGARVVREL